MPEHAPIHIAVIGKPNVGKSTLINRLIGKREAIVSDVAGLTRDRTGHQGVLAGRKVCYLDTGGLLTVKDELTQNVKKQIEKAFHLSQVLLFVFDMKTGLSNLDHELLSFVRKHLGQKRLIPVINKADNHQGIEHFLDYYSLGLGEPVVLSAEHKHNFDLLLERVEKEIKSLTPSTSPQPTRQAEKPVPVAVIGKPNVGKSSLFNALLQEERSIVHHQAGTTRDAVEEVVMHDQTPIAFIDTAGLRRKSKVREEIEFYSTVRARKSIKSCQICLLVMEAHLAVSHQDKKIFGEITQAGRAVLILLNKWDLAKEKNFAQVCDRLRFLLPGADYAEILAVSALKGLNLDRIFPKIKRLHANFNRRIETPLLNQWLEGQKPLPIYKKGKNIKIHYMVQSKSAPPTFVLFTNHPELMDEGISRFFSNRLRLNFGFEGCPIRIYFRKK